MRTRVAAATLAACALVLSGCTGDGSTDPSPTPTTTTASPTPAPSPTPSATPSPTATASPTPSPSPTPTSAAVPDDLSTIADDGEVTLAEAQAVIDIQDEIYNDAVIALLTRPADEEGAPARVFFDSLASVYTEELRNGYGDAWTQLALAGFDGLDTDRPLGVSNRVEDVLSATGTCFFVRMERDASGIAVGPEPTQTYWTSIRSDGENLAPSPNGWHRDIEGFDEPAPDEDFCQQRPSSGDGT